MTVKEYLKADRQWPRHLRLAHAKMQFEQPGSDKEFWGAIIVANTVAPMIPARRAA